MCIHGCKHMQHGHIHHIFSTFTDTLCSVKSQIHVNPHIYTAATQKYMYTQNKPRHLQPGKAGHCSDNWFLVARPDSPPNPKGDH